MSFNEFILAVGENGLHEALKSQDYELINAYAGKYTDLLKKYYYVGGMPEVVQTYIDSDDLFEVREIQNNLLQYYEEDFSVISMDYARLWMTKTPEAFSFVENNSSQIKIL